MRKQDLGFGTVTSLDLKALVKFRDRLAEDPHDQVHCGGRIPRWIDNRLETYVFRYNQISGGRRLTKVELITELLIVGLAAYPMPKEVDDDI